MNRYVRKKINIITTTEKGKLIFVFPVFLYFFGFCYKVGKGSFNAFE
jgi:hypothetical protein